MAKYLAANSHEKDWAQGQNQKLGDGLSLSQVANKTAVTVSEISAYSSSRGSVSGRLQS